MGIAPLVAAVRRRPAHWKFGVPATSGTAGPVLDGGDGGLIGLTVEIFINSAWTDITQWVYRRGVITITRGRADETSQVQPQTARIVLDDRDGRFSPRNPTGPYYGQLQRNTPLRVSRLNNGIRRYRFYGEVPAWPLASDITGKDATVTITASGMLRRLRSGNQALRSAMTRAYTIAYTSSDFVFQPVLAPAAYWPCEDGANATQIASGLTGGTPMTVSGSPKFATDTSFPGSAALPQLNGSTWRAAVPPVPAAAANILQFLLSVPAGGEPNAGVVARMTTTGTVARVDLAYTTASAGTITMIGYNSAGTQLFASSPVTGVSGAPKTIALTLTPDPTPGVIDWQFGYFDLIGIGAGDFSGTVSGTLGYPTQVTVNTSGSLGNTAVGHVACQTAYDPLSFGGVSPSVGPAMTGWDPESPIVRFSRLCGEQNVAAVDLFLLDATDPLGGLDPGDETAMGPQPIDTFGNLLQEISDSLFVPLYESRDQLALMMRSKGTIYNQPAKLTLDIAQHHLSGPLTPVDDDQLTRNDITVTRNGGSSYELALTSGSMSTLPPPAGIGSYPYSYNLSLSSDSMLPDMAGWRLRFGTVDEPRYPQIPVNVRRFVGNVDLTNAVLTIDIGDRLDIINPPGPQFAPDPISQIVQGYTENLSNFEHDIVFSCSPASPWNVGYADDPVYGHADTDGSTLAGSYPLGTETTLLVSTTGAATGSPLWTTSAGDFPFDIAVGGERMTVTNITGASSPQTFIVTRSVNTVVKGQVFGTDVRLWQPMYTSV